ncbi:AAA family ATPase [Nocardia sp. NPDC052112]|uniref:ATP-binding protein n=1 Tax=Nocardia sp. NPDC052112 TaxID=3155646 RepID=UPI00342E9CD8
MSAQRPPVSASLPARTSDFVGRERELEKITTLFLSSTRLITLIGSGGIGKTRLATEAAHRYHKARRAPIHWVRLARLPAGSDATAVEDELAHSIIDVDFSNRSSWDALIDTFTRTDGASRNLQTILVMDNCEHVLDGVGRVITGLLDAVPGLTVLATSREAIGWVDEQLVPVPALSREQALTLFRARAELTGHPIAGDDDAAVAGSICWHVHNHPLYIRLAAARLIRQPLPMILRDLSGEDSDRRLPGRARRCRADARRMRRRLHRGYTSRRKLADRSVGRSRTTRARRLRLGRRIAICPRSELQISQICITTSLDSASSSVNHSKKGCRSRWATRYSAHTYRFNR